VLSGALGQQAGAQKTLGLAQTQEQVAQAQTAAAQGYYNLGQAAQKLALGGMTLQAEEQNQLVQQLAAITTQSLGMQQQMWKQAMDGYGLMGQIIGQAAQSYGYSLDAYKNVLTAQENQAGIEAGLQEKQMAADSQGTSDLFSSLGSILGSQGIGGLFGGGGGGAAGGAAGAGVGAVGTGVAAGGILAGTGGAVDAAGMAVVAVFAV
jgi:hypothetical protein